MMLNIVCPFCKTKHPIPTDFDNVYTCSCGGCYWVSSTYLQENEMAMVPGEMWENDLLPFPDEEQMEICQVVVNREFEKLISLKESMDETSEMRFCKYDPSAELALVWIKRP